MEFSHMLAWFPLSFCLQRPMPHFDQFPTFRFSRRHAGSALACVLVCCAAVPRAQADSPFSCPAPRSAVRTKTAPLQEPSLAAGGKIDLFGDTLSYGLNGKGTVNGHVTVHQGQRTMKSDDAEYEAGGDQVAVQGKVDY